MYLAGASNVKLVNVLSFPLLLFLIFSRMQVTAFLHQRKRLESLSVQRYDI